MNSTLRIIVTGLIAQHPFTGGISWHYLHYVLGLARLGHDVWYIEDSGEWPYNVDGGPSGNNWVARDCSRNVGYLTEIMAAYGLESKWAYHFPTECRWFGLSDKERTAVIKSADLLINVSGTLVHPDHYRSVRRMAYIDTDPVFTQIHLAQGDSDRRNRVDVHDVHFSFGECFSEGVPSTVHQWRPTRQPILLSEWRVSAPTRDVFTTVMNWTSYKSVVYRGLRFAQKDVEFMRFLDLPGKVTPTVLEVALAQTEHPEWQTREAPPPSSPENSRPDDWESTPAELLAHNGWRVVDAVAVCSDLYSYRSYIESSKAEWSVAKNAYVVGRPGWFSERSACYLAAGRPVVVQDTGIGAVLPVGEGILLFRTPQEAVAAIHEVEADYQRHADSARAIAEQYFDSGQVLRELLERAFAP